ASPLLLEQVVRQGPGFRIVRAVLLFAEFQCITSDSKKCFQRNQGSVLQKPVEFLVAASDFNPSGVAGPVHSICREILRQSLPEPLGYRRHAVWYQGADELAVDVAIRG